MFFRKLGFARALVLLLGTGGAAVSAQTPEEVASAALEAAPIFDGHNDTPMQIRFRFTDLTDEFDFLDTRDLAHSHPAGQPMHTDLTRAREGKLGAQFWSVYVPPTLPEPEAVKMTLEQIDLTRRLIARYPDDLALATSADDVEHAIASGRIASLMGMEGGHSIGSSLAVLRQMHALGARYMTLTHTKNLSWADSESEAPKHDGLTEFGKDVVREMNRIGMLVDLSHVSEATMHDALDAAQVPVIFSHSNARALVGASRNVPDSVLLRLRENGGIIMVTSIAYLVSDERWQWVGRRKAEEARLAYHHTAGSKAYQAGMSEWLEAHPEVKPTISDLADHVDHIRTVAGIDHIGIGGDYDGWPHFPVGMEDVTGYPALFAELARRGYTQQELEKISLRNMLRVLREAEEFASRP